MSAEFGLLQNPIEEFMLSVGYDVPLRSLLTREIRAGSFGLDIGGHASSSAYLPAHSQFIGIDPKAYGLRDLQRFLNFASEDFGLSPAGDMVVGDGRLLPFGQNTFDVVVLKQVYCHVFKAQKLLEETQRVLKPGGKFIFIDWQVPEDYDIQLPSSTNIADLSGLLSAHEFRIQSSGYVREMFPVDPKEPKRYFVIAQKKRIERVPRA